MQAVTAAIIERNGKILLARRREGDSMGGWWEFPGGGVDAGETPDQCVVRELLEELDVQAEPLELFDVTVCGDGRLAVLFYKCRISGEPKPLDCDELQWVAPADLLRYKLLPGDEVIAKKLAR